MTASAEPPLLQREAAGTAEKHVIAAKQMTRRDYFVTGLCHASVLFSLISARYLNTKLYCTLTKKIIYERSGQNFKAHSPATMLRVYDGGTRFYS